MFRQHSMLVYRPLDSTIPTRPPVLTLVTPLAGALTIATFVVMPLSVLKLLRYAAAAPTQKPCAVLPSTLISPSSVRLRTIAMWSLSLPPIVPNRPRLWLSSGISCTSKCKPEMVLPLPSKIPAKLFLLVPMGVHASVKVISFISLPLMATSPALTLSRNHLSCVSFVIW